MSSETDILARLVRNGQASNGQDNPWAALAATEPAHEANPDQSGDDAKLNGLLQRINQLTARHRVGRSRQSECSPAAR